MRRHDIIQRSNVSEHILEALGYILGNTIRLAQIIQSYGWNLPQSASAEMRELFARHLAELNAAADEIAVYIGDLVPGCVSEFVDITVDVNPTLAGASPNTAGLFRNLRLAHEQAIMSLEAAIEVALEFDHPPTQKLLHARLGTHKAALANLTNRIGDQTFHDKAPRPN